MVQQWARFALQVSSISTEVQWLNILWLHKFQINQSEWSIYLYYAIVL
jgi:hypothetical protein